MMSKWDDRTIAVLILWFDDSVHMKNYFSDMKNNNFKEYSLQYSIYRTFVPYGIKEYSPQQEKYSYFNVNEVNNVPLGYGCRIVDISSSM